MRISCITLDDSKMDLEALKDCISKHDIFEHKAEFSTPKKAIDYLKDHHVDLIFSDIEMPGIDGLSMIRSLDDPPAVVFVSSHPEMAIDGFELAAIDFINKPLSNERFAKCAEKCETFFAFKSRPEFSTPHIQQGFTTEDYIVVKDGTEFLRINTMELIYVEANGDFANIYTLQHKYLVLVNLKNIMAQIPENVFIRCHKSYLVNPKYISRMASRNITLINQVMIPISSEYMEHVESIFVGKRLIKRKA